MKVKRINEENGEKSNRKVSEMKRTSKRLYRVKKRRICCRRDK
jgi:hypothetical protein